MYIYDIEVAPNLFLVVFKHVRKSTKKVFTLFNGKEKVFDEREQLFSFLKKKPKLIGFNNHKYDDVIIYKFQELCKVHLSLERLLKKIKQFSDTVIMTDDWFDRYQKSVDLFKIWHFNNKARRMSLKACAAKLHFENVQDLVFDPNKPIEDNELLTVQEYCINDVEATERLYIESQDKLQLRKMIYDEYGINVLSDPDTTIGEKIFLYELSKKTNKSPWFLKKLRTHRDKIVVKDIIFDYIEFENEKLKKTLNFYKDCVLHPDSKLEYFTTIDYLQFDFGLGGLHATNKSGSSLPKKKKTVPSVWEASDEYKIVLVDFSSYYPNIAIKNKVFPEHLSKEFCDVYEDIYIRRKEAKYSGNKLVDTALKLSLNGAYGKSNDKYSFLYDTKYTFTITINGQLMLAMLTERLMKLSKVIQCNTDGVYIYIHKDNIKAMQEVCRSFESLTQLKLDEEYFSKIIMRDVNNYIAIKEDGSTKEKGAYEVKKDIHKMYQSGKIVQLAVQQYYLNNTPIEETITNHDDFRDFIIVNRLKRSSDSNLVYYDNNLKKTVLPKTNRFIVTKEGNRIVKEYSDGRNEIFKVGYNLTNVNVLPEIFNMNEIDYRFYIEEANKLLINKPTQQLKLFA